MPNTWVSFVKEFASKKKMKYNEALKSADCKAEYQKNKPKSSDDMKREMNEVIDKTPMKIPKMPKKQMKMEIVETPLKMPEMNNVEVKVRKPRIKKMRKDQV